MILCTLDTVCNRQGKIDGTIVCCGDNNCGWQQTTPPTKIDIFEGILDKLLDTYRRKNADYGNSFTKIREKYGNTAFLIRIEDKFNRLERLMNGNEQMVKDESIEDTLKDMAVYCLLELVERRAEGEKVNSHE